MLVHQFTLLILCTFFFFENYDLCKDTSYGIISKGLQGHIGWLCSLYMAILPHNLEIPFAPSLTHSYL